MYKYLIKPLLFLFSPETAHRLVCSVLKIFHRFPFFSFFLRKFYCVKNGELKKNVFGLEFPNPVGLAAGFDKDAKYVNELADFGFGFIEIGTVTPLPQPGNPKPRLFRLKEDEALINRMGFNNEGAEAAAARLRKRKTKTIIGGNIGKNKATPNEKAMEDYEKCFKALFAGVDYFVVNVSSPNTPGLRELQEKEPLTKILLRLQEINRELSHISLGKPRPVLLKIAPDLTDRQLDDIIEIVIETKIDGVIAANTTLSRDHLLSPASGQSGGLSGRPLAKRSTEVIRYICARSGNSFPVIGVGGIHSAEDALEKLEAGASLVQIYTGFIYEGPGLVKKILEGIKKNKKEARS